jgi:DNA-binding HxlR family transcriptional regulator
MPSCLPLTLTPDVMQKDCQSRRILQHMTSRWAVLVLIALNGKTVRFSGLRRQIGGISERMLAQTLQVLEGDGLVLRRAFDVVPPHVEYELTDLGRGAAERLHALAGWIESNLGLMLDQSTGSSGRSSAKMSSTSA